MPMFDFVCPYGHKAEDVLVASSEVKEIDCPTCGADAIQQFPACNPIFAGEGWAKDGYTKGSRKK